MDRRSIPLGGFWVGGDSAIMQILPDLIECGSTGGSVTADRQKTAGFQWLADRDVGMLVLHGIIFGSQNGISSSGV